MSDLLKKGFLLGLGAAVSGKEKVKKVLDELVEKDQITPAQAKEMFQRFVSKGEEKTSEWQGRQQDQVEKFAEEMGLATQQDLEKLKARIQKLEASHKKEE